MSGFQTKIQKPDYFTTRHVWTIWIPDLSSIQRVTASNFLVTYKLYYAHRNVHSGYQTSLLFKRFVFWMAKNNSKSNHVALNCFDFGCLSIQKPDFYLYIVWLFNSVRDPDYLSRFWTVGQVKWAIPNMSAKKSLKESRFRAPGYCSWIWFHTAKVHNSQNNTVAYVN